MNGGSLEVARFTVKFFCYFIAEVYYWNTEITAGLKAIKISLESPGTSVRPQKLVTWRLLLVGTITSQDQERLGLAWCFREVLACDILNWYENSQRTNRSASVPEISLASTQAFVISRAGRYKLRGFVLRYRLRHGLHSWKVCNPC